MSWCGEEGPQALGTQSLEFGYGAVSRDALLLRRTFRRGRRQEQCPRPQSLPFGIARHRADRSAIALSNSRR